MFTKIGDALPITAVYKSTDINDATAKETLKSVIDSVKEKQDKEVSTQIKEELEKN